MRTLETYLASEVGGVQPLVESTVSIGQTDSMKGNQCCGPHHHDYILWDPAQGWGKTGPALDEPKKASIHAAMHEHMIVDGKVLESCGHTHELKAPIYTGEHSNFAPQAVQVKEVDG